ncbi:Gfo/Idh/MocA family oxidoreductase [Verrucomicrobia bacterium]|nr:Gfo/Idh/MocA family oxidoreductase [Verrucomicrobiota bacterium]
MKEKIEIGLIGAGRWGPNVIGAFRRMDNVELNQVADSNSKAVEMLSARFGNLNVTPDANEVIESDTIDAIAICTPVETHLELVEKSLEAGKHVFVEKPFGRDSHRCSQLCSIAEERKLSIVVGHVFLFNSSILELKKIIDSGELGEIQHLEAHRTNLGPVRKDVNAVWDLTSHDASIFDFLLDSLPESVSCVGSRRLDPKIEDTSYTTFRYPGSIIAHAHASWLNPRKVRQITVIGSKKMALWDDLNIEHPITIYDSSIGLDQSYYSDSFASHRLSYNRGDVTLPSIPTNEPLFDELKHFIEVLRGSVENRSSGRYGVEIAITLQAADESLNAAGAFIKTGR